MVSYDKGLYNKASGLVGRRNVLSGLGGLAAGLGTGLAQRSERQRQLAASAELGGQLGLSADATAGVSPGQALQALIARQAQTAADERARLNRENQLAVAQTYRSGAGGFGNYDPELLERALRGDTEAMAQVDPKALTAYRLTWAMSHANELPADPLDLLKARIAAEGLRQNAEDATDPEAAARAKEIAGSAYRMTPEAQARGKRAMEGYNEALGNVRGIGEGLMTRLPEALQRQWVPGPQEASPEPPTVNYGLHFDPSNYGSWGASQRNQLTPEQIQKYRALPPERQAEAKQRLADAKYDVSGL